MRDRVLVLQAPEWDEAGELKTWSAGLLASQLRLVNGQLNPRIPIREETQRWRILNATVSDFFDLQLEGTGSCRSPPTAIRSSARSSSTRSTSRPADRVEVLVEGGSPGTHALRALPFDHGAGFVAPELVLATVEASPAGGGRTVRPRRLLSRSAISRELPVANRRTLTFTMRGGFLIDGKPLRSRAGRPGRRARHRRGVDGGQRQSARAPLPHPRQSRSSSRKSTGSRWTSPVPRHRLDLARSAAASRSAPCSRTSRAGPCSTATSSRTPISG